MPMTKLEAIFAVAPLFTSSYVSMSLFSRLRQKGSNFDTISFYSYRRVLSISAAASASSLRFLSAALR